MGAGNRQRIRWDMIAPILAAAPILVLTLAFLHEVGRASHYGMPIELVRLETTTIFVNVAQTLLLSLLVGMNLGILLLVGSRKGFWSVWAFVNATVTVSVLYASLEGYFTILFPGLLTIFLFIVEFLPLVGVRNLDLLHLDLLHIKDMAPRSPLMWAGVFLFVFVVMAYASGLIVPTLQRTYFIPSTQPNSVVLRIYGDDLICAPLANDTTIKRSFSILKVSDNLTLSPRTFPGPLGVAKK
jgi:hypothetical protein